MAVVGEYSFVKKQSNKELLYTLARVRKEKARPDIYGKYGTSRYVPATEFYGRTGIAAVRKEIARRQSKGLISKSAGKARKRSSNIFGSNFRL